MTALVGLCAIIHITICLPTQILSGNFYILADYNWSVRCLGRIFDESETALESIEEEGDLILKEEFIIIIL